MYPPPGKQAYLLVLTVNVIVIFLILQWVGTFFFIFKAACVLWVKAAKTSVWPGLVQKLVQTLFNSVLFSLSLFFLFLKNQMSIVGDECIYFRFRPHLQRIIAQCVRLRWRQDPVFFSLFCF